MFTRPEIGRELEKYVRARLYTDGEGELYEGYQKLQQDRFGTVALPYYAIIDANGTPIRAFPGLTRDAEEFLAFVR